MANFLFRQGYAYVAGVDKPVYVTKGMAVDAIEEMGFKVMFAEPCESAPRLPFQMPGKCGDEWDWLGGALRTGPDESIDVPDRVQWITEIPKPVPAQPPQPGQPAPPSPAQPPPQTWTNPEATKMVPPGAPAKAATRSRSLVVPALVGGVVGYLVVRLFT